MKNGLDKRVFKFSCVIGVLFVLSGCNHPNTLNQTAPTGMKTATPMVLTPNETATTTKTEAPAIVSPWDQGQELFPGEYMLLPEQELVPVEMDKLPSVVTPPACKLGCLSMVSLFNVYWSQHYYTTSIPYEFWPEMGKQYANKPIKAKIKFSLGLATRGDYNIQQQFAGVNSESAKYANNTMGESGIRVPGKDHREVYSDSGVMMYGWSNMYQNEPAPDTDQFSVLVDWDTLGKDSGNIDWGNYGLQLNGICLDFYFKHNEQFFHRACQPVLRQPREGKFQIGLKLPKDITSVWVAVRPYNNDQAASDFSNVYRSEDVYGVWLVNLQDVTPTSMGSIDVTCKNMNCLPVGSISSDGFDSNQYPMPVFCPGDTFMGSTISKPVKFMGGIFAQTDLFGQENLWTDVSGRDPVYYINLNALDLEPDMTGKPFPKDNAGSYRSVGTIISKDDKNIIKSPLLIPITGIQLDRPIKYGLFYEGANGSDGPIDNSKDQQIWTYRLPRYSVSDSSMGFNMSAVWRYQCSK